LEWYDFAYVEEWTGVLSVIYSRNVLKSVRIKGLCQNCLKLRQ
jgi:hypothetical protein